MNKYILQKLKWTNLGSFTTSYKIRPRYEIYYRKADKPICYREEHIYSIVEYGYDGLPDDGECVVFPSKVEKKDVIRWFTGDITMTSQIVTNWNE